jgi:hypothetical protein
MRAFACFLGKGSFFMDSNVVQRYDHCLKNLAFADLLCRRASIIALAFREFLTCKQSRIWHVGCGDPGMSSNGTSETFQLGQLCPHERTSTENKALLPSTAH